MMERKLELDLQAYLDGELPDSERGALEAYIAKDSRAQALLAEMKAVGNALELFEAESKLPVSREFYWNGIERQILDSQAPAAAAFGTGNWGAALRRFLVPAGAVATLIVAGIVTSRQLDAIGAAEVTRLESALSAPGAFTYRNFDNQTTLVWIAYPAENEFADSDSTYRIQ